MREDLCRNFTLHIFLSVANVSKIRKQNVNLFVLANVSKIRKQNVNLFVLSLIAHMFTMKLITYADGLSYRRLETYGGILGYRGLHKTVQCRKAFISFTI